MATPSVYVFATVRPKLCWEKRQDRLRFRFTHLLPTVSRLPSTSASGFPIYPDRLATALCKLVATRCMAKRRLLGCSAEETETG